MDLPEKFKARMREMLQDEYDDFLKAMNESPLFTGLRINALKKDAYKALIKEFGRLDKVEWCDMGYYADKSVISGNHPYHLAGLFYFQEPSAMSTVSALPIEKDDYILDLCAAPGGKATQAGALLGEEGLLVANEIIKSRANILADNIERFGIKNAVVTNETPQRLGEKYPDFFDKIIVDAPCSGEGMFRKEPQAVDNWCVEHTVSCGIRQQNILDSAMKMLRGGGYLIYSTCTFAPEENEKICAYMLENYNVEMVEPNDMDMLCKGQNQWSQSGFDVSLSRRIFPHKQKGEGHFLALFHSLDKAAADRKTYPEKKCDGERLFREFEDSFLNTHLKGEFCMFGEKLYLKPEGADIDKIKTIKPGLFLGICRKNRFEPSYGLCTALNKEDIRNTLDFEPSSETLKKYLMGETIPCHKQGWCAVTVSGYPLGWGKASNNQLKNHFPKYLRVKK